MGVDAEAASVAGGAGGGAAELWLAHGLCGGLFADGRGVFVEVCGGAGGSCGGGGGGGGGREIGVGLGGMLCGALMTSVPRGLSVWVVELGVVGIRICSECSIDVDGRPVRLCEVGHVVFRGSVVVLAHGTVLCADVSNQRVEAGMYELNVVLVHDLLVDESGIFDLLAEAGMQEMQLSR